MATSSVHEPGEGDSSIHDECTRSSLGQERGLKGEERHDGDGSEDGQDDAAARAAALRRNIDALLTQDVISHAVESGRTLDLRDYRTEIAEDGQAALDAVVAACAAQAPALAAIVQQIRACDDTLGAVQSVLLDSETVVGGLGQSVVSLQGQSKETEVKLRNRAALARKLGVYVHSAIVDEALIETLARRPIDGVFVRAFAVLERKFDVLKPRRGRSEVAAATVAHIEKLAERGCERAYVFLADRIRSLRTANTNTQVLRSQTLLQFGELFGFLVRHKPDAAEHITALYVQVLSETYGVAFKTYMQSLRNVVGGKRVHAGSTLGARADALDVAGVAATSSKLFGLKSPIRSNEGEGDHKGESMRGQSLSSLSSSVGGAGGSGAAGTESGGGGDGDDGRRSSSVGMFSSFMKRRANKVLGSNDPSGKRQGNGGKAFTDGSVPSNTALSAFVLGLRGDVLDRIAESPIIPHRAMLLYKKTRVYLFEDAFRSLSVLLIEAVAAECDFCRGFFGAIDKDAENDDDDTVPTGDTDSVELGSGGQIVPDVVELASAQARLEDEKRRPCMDDLFKGMFARALKSIEEYFVGHVNGTPRPAWFGPHCATDK